MPPFLVGAAGLLVAPLVIANDHPRLLRLRRPPSPTQQHQAARVQRPAHLLQRHLRVFPPAAARCAATRTPARSDPGASAATDCDSPAPRSASTPLPAWPRGTCVRWSPGGTPLVAAAPAT